MMIGTLATYWAAEAMFVAGAILIMGAGFAHTRLFNISAGFVIIAAPWFFERLTVDPILSLEFWLIAIGTLLIVVLSGLFAFIFADKIFRRREFYILFSFFTALVLFAWTAIKLSPDFGAVTASNISLIASVGSLAFAVAYLWLMFGLTMQPAQLKLDIIRNAWTLPNRVRLGLMLAAEGLALLIFSLLNSGVHKGVLLKGEELSVLFVIILALIRPETWQTTVLAALIGALFVVCVRGSEAFIVGHIGSATFDIFPMLLLVLAGGAAAVISANAPGRALPTDPAFFFRKTVTKDTAFTVASIAGIVAVLYFFDLVSLGRTSVTVVLFGFIVFLVKGLTGVMTIFMPTLAFGAVLIVAKLASMEMPDPVFLTALAALLVALSFLAQGYFTFLRKQSSDMAILFDLIATYSVSHTMAGFYWLSGSEGFLPVRVWWPNLVHVLFWTSTAMMMTALFIGAIPFFLRWLTQPDAPFGKWRGHRFGILLVPTFLHSGRLHGFEVRLILLGLTIAAVMTSVAVAGMAAISAGGISFEDYGIMPGLKALGIALMIAASQAMWPGVLALCLLLLLAYSVFSGFGLWVTFAVGVLGLTALSLVLMQERPAAGGPAK